MNGLTFRSYLGPRTNNHLEGWHCYLRKAIGAAHPNILHFIKAIKKQEKQFELKLLQLNSNGVVTVQRGLYVAIEKKLANAMADYRAEELTVKGLLDNAGRAIRLSIPNQ